MPQPALSTEKQTSGRPEGVKKKHTNPLWKRKLASLSRWLHIYLSMVSFGVVFFFSITGITLNHQDRFTGTQTVTHYKGQVDAKWVAGDNVDKLATVEYLRKTNGIKGAVSDFRIDPDQCGVSFKGPGYAADAFIDRRTGKYELNETRMGLIAVLNDLHKGRDSGKSWAWIIDLSAALLVLVSLTGIILLCYLNKRRFTGFVAAFAGAVACYLVYVIWVP